jgi:membrane protease YdiL (CAAX protease family)
MNDLPEREYPYEPDEEPPPAVLPAPRKKGLPWLAWPVILILCALAVLTAHVRHEPQDDGDDLEDMGLRMQARYAVAAGSLTGEGRNLLGSLERLRQGPLPDRLRFAIVAGELAGPKEARKFLGEAKAAVAKKELRPKRDQVKLLNILDRLYLDYAHARMDAPSVNPAERQALARQLGWFGDLALAPAAPAATPKGPADKGAPAAGPPNPGLRDEVLDEAYRTFWTIILGVVSALGLGGLGLLLLVGFLILAANGKVRSALPAGVAHGGVYAETFAVWMLLFAGLSVATVLMKLPQEERSLWAAAAPLLSLAALAWPVLRGVPWGQVRRDVGLTVGRRPALEPACGVGCYLMSLPLLGVGLVVVVVIVLIEQALTGEPGGSGPLSRAAHPIVRDLVHGSWRERLQLFLLASVVAPLVEETMFRGVLYRHLREASRRLGTVASFLVSATVVSFLFAVIHPQGLLGVPLLMPLAFGFALAREWRGSLAASMVGHGLNNGLVFLFTILALGD